MYNVIKHITSHPLNRNRRFKSLIAYLKWQIGSRIAPGPVVYDWIEGSRVIVRPGETGFTQNIYCGLHEYSEMGYILHVLTSNDVFIDVGANVGSYTILACAVKGASGVCFEPVPGTYHKLMDNIRLNGIVDRVMAYNLCVAEEDGEALFTTSHISSVDHIKVDGELDGSTIKVRACALDSVLADMNPSVMKIDVEGYEYPTLLGAKKILANRSLHSVIVELNGSGARYGYEELEIVAMMKDYGFEPYSYSPRQRKLAKLEGKNNDSGNTLFLRDSDAIKEKIAAARKVKVQDTWI